MKILIVVIKVAVAKVAKQIRLIQNQQYPVKGKARQRHHPKNNLPSPANANKLRRTPPNHLILIRMQVKEPRREKGLSFRSVE